MNDNSRALPAARLLLAAQVIHGFIPAHTHEHSVVGPIVGLLLLVATMTAIVALHRRSAFGLTVLRTTGLAVAVGFVLYHALPWHTPFTRPYLGEAVGAPAWIGVAIAVAAGLLAAAATRPAQVASV